MTPEESAELGKHLEDIAGDLCELMAHHNAVPDGGQLEWWLYGEAWAALFARVRAVLGAGAVAEYRAPKSTKWRGARWFEMSTHGVTLIVLEAKDD